MEVTILIDCVFNVNGLRLDPGSRDSRRRPRAVMESTTYNYIPNRRRESGSI